MNPFGTEFPIGKNALDTHEKHPICIPKWEEIQMEATMFKRAIISPATILGIGFLLVGSAQADPPSKADQRQSLWTQGGFSREQFFVTQYASSAEKPQFPPPEERKKIKTSRRVFNTYPQISVNGSFLIKFQDNSELNRSFRRFEAAYGFQGNENYSGARESWCIGLRLYVARRWSLWWQYIAGDDATPRSIGLSALYSAVHTKPISLSFGIGRVSQRLQTEREYHCSLEPPSGYTSSTLEKISVDTGEKAGWLLTAVLDFWGQAAGQTTGCFLALQYIATPTASKSLRFPYTETEAETEMRISMSHFLVSGGVSFNFQI
jgi:hypothetical protein